MSELSRYDGRVPEPPYSTELDIADADVRALELERKNAALQAKLEAVKVCLNEPRQNVCGWYLKGGESKERLVEMAGEFFRLYRKEADINKAADALLNEAKS